MPRLIAEIKRRRVIPVAAWYVVGAWLVLQAADILLPAWGVPPRAIQLVVYAALLGSLLAKEEAAAWFAKIADHEIFGPPAQSMIKAVAGDNGAAFRQLAALIDENTANQDWLYSASLMALRSGHAEDAVALLEQMAPSLSDPLAPEVTEQNAEMALLLATVLADVEGNEVRTGILSGMLLNTARNRPAIGWDGIGLRAARINALQGDIEKAIDAAEAVYEQGLREFYTSEGLLPPPLETLVGNPRFDRLLKQVDADLAVMRERAVVMVEAQDP